MNDSSVKGRLAIWIAPMVGLMVAGGIWQQRDLRQLRMEKTSWLDLARSRGIDPDSPGALPSKPYPRRDLSEDVRALTDALIRRAEKGYVSRTDWAEEIELADQFEGLNPAQLREMVGILLKEDGMPGEVRVRLSVDLLKRLAKDFPQEALALMMELEPQLPEDFFRPHFTEHLAAMAGRLGEHSPDAAWG